MKKILVVDLLTEKSHKNFNENILNLFSEIYDVDFYCLSEYKGRLEFKNTFYLNKKYNKNVGKVKNILNQIILLFKMKKILKERTYEKIVFLAYESISFSIFWRNCSVETYIFNHYNLDQRGIAKKFIRDIKGATHIVLEEYIKKKFDSILKSPVKVLVHPYYDIDKKEEEIKKGLIFSPSASNDRDSFEKLLNYVKNNSNYSLIGKSVNKVREPRIRLSKFFDDYYNNMEQAEFVFLPVSIDYRVSGVFYEALQFSKKIICLESCAGIFIKEMSKKYPNSVRIIKSFNDIEIKVDEKERKKEVEKFLSEYSDEKRLEKLEKILRTTK